MSSQPAPSSPAELLPYSDEISKIAKYKVGEPVAKVLRGSNLWRLWSPGPVEIQRKKVECAEGFITHPRIDKARWYARQKWLIQNYKVTAEKEEVQHEGSVLHHGQEDYYDDDDEEDEEIRRENEALIIDDRITEFAALCDKNKNWFGSYWHWFNMSEQG